MSTTLEFLIEAPPEARGQPIELEVSAEGLVVGRNRDCDVCLDDARVSRRHARLVEEAGGVRLEDLGAPNGTVVNGRRVGRHALASGDVLSFGRFRLRVLRVGARPDSTGIVKAPAPMPRPRSGQGRAAFYQALGLGDDTLLDPRASDPAALLLRSRRYAALHELGRVLASARSTQAALEGALDLAIEVTDGDRAYIALSGLEAEAAEDEADTLPPAPGMRLAASRSRHTGPSEAERTVPPLSETLARQVITERKAVLSRDPADDSRLAGSRSLFLREAGALMAVPIVLHDVLLGVLVVESTHFGQFDEETLDLLGAFAPAVGQSLENQRLAERREATIRELEQTKERLLGTRQQLVRAERLAVVGRLASGLAHEVKNHLAPFMLADTLARKFPDDEELQAAMEMMLEARQHILDLVSEVKAFARGSGESAGRKEPVELEVLARSVIRFMACDAEVSRHALELKVEGEPLVSAHSGRLRQVVVNLVKNAADAIGSDREGRIVLGVSEQGKTATLYVEDDGPGVPEAAQDKLFAPFYSTKGEKGLGLGLDIARRIARDHGGDLVLDQAPGRGARFVLRLPGY